MKVTIAIAAAMICALSTGVMAAPKVIKADPNKIIPVSELINYMGKFDDFDVLDMSMADTVAFFHVPDSYNFDDYEMACSAMDVAGLKKLRAALANDPAVVSLFKANDYNVNDVVAIVHNPEQKSFSVYLR